MSKEAIDELKRLRSILSGITGLEDDDQEYIEDARKSVDRIIEALAEQPAQQEPVAWLVDNGGDAILIRHYQNFPGVFAGSEFNKRPLVFGDISPQAQPQQEPVAAECKFDREQKWVRCEIAHHNLVQSEPEKWPGYQTRLLYTPPPAQRTWVGLTDDEISILSASMGFDPCVKGVIRDAEAKLKEKNT